MSEHKKGEPSDGNRIGKATSNNVEARGISRRQALAASLAAGVASSVVGGAAVAASSSMQSRHYPGFKGEIRRTMLESKPWWPPEKRAPDAAPNIVIILCDDLGFADVGCFGSEIETPNLDRIASEGLRYTNFHSEPTCSPTRAAMLTGINPHATGYGFPSISGGADPGFPGYSWQLADNARTMAEIYRDNGYSTLAIGKWHLSRPIDTHEGMTTTSWPTRRGFDRYYGNWGCPNLHLPDEIWSDHHIIQTDQYPEGYFYNDDLTDQAISMIRGVRQGDPDKPFMLYFALSSPHAPINAKKQDIAKYKGRYDSGWDEIRRERFERQKKMGVIGADWQLPANNSERGMEAPSWSTMGARSKELSAAYMEAYAGLIDNIDQNIGKLRAAIEQMGEWENTIFIFTADNGASKEGAGQGTSQYGDLIYRVLQARGQFKDAGEEELDLDYQHLQDGLIGGPRTLPHYPQAWAMAGNTPFRLYKSTTFLGGHNVPFVVSWPAGLKKGGQLRRQYTHVTDILPTLLDLTGLNHPAQVPGSKLKTMTGVSFAHTLTDRTAASRHIEQYTESAGSRRYYRNGWAIVTNHQPMAKIDDTEWLLFNLKEDPTEINDLAKEHPDILKSMSEAWERAAWENQVFPLNEGSGVAFLSHAPYEERFAQPLTLFPNAPTVPMWRARWLMEGRSFAVRSKFDYDSGFEGTLFKHGGQGGGYGFYVDGGKLLFVLNEYGRMREISGGDLAQGPNEAVLQIRALEGFSWAVELWLNDKRVAEKSGLRALTAYVPIGGIDIGIDRRSPISWRHYELHGAFPYTGSLAFVRYEPGEWAPDMAPGWAENLRKKAQAAPR